MVIDELFVIVGSAEVIVTAIEFMVLPEVEVKVTEVALPVQVPLVRVPVLALKLEPPVKTMLVILEDAEKVKDPPVFPLALYVRKLVVPLLFHTRVAVDVQVPTDIDTPSTT